jgi:ribosome-associated protein
MADDSAVMITATLRIPLAELSFRASRSGGPGGQHVNTSSTRVELWWDAARSPSLTEEERRRVTRRLANRLTDDGLLRLVSTSTRSQARNKAEAIERFREVLAAALVVPKRRRATRPSRGVKERRLAEKRKQSERKRERRRPAGED